MVADFGVVGGVYPRACGGTEWSRRQSRATRGLSPRVRGNLVAAADGQQRRRSIPARAGEPLPKRLPGQSPRVYPRACGGTQHVAGRQLRVEGLSPRVRGNPPARLNTYRMGGSIPARAGEPNLCSVEPHYPGVYPRACGGTETSQPLNSRATGLSPRVRGNPMATSWNLLGLRSIPARAGEPVPFVTPATATEVYPRACGGTDDATWRDIDSQGLSPRVRGNLTITTITVARAGSIPARAGEPVPMYPRRIPARVYPRACGGTQELPRLPLRSEGLSPRVRGNLNSPLGDDLLIRSIPARAGEPR